MFVLNLVTPEKKLVTDLEIDEVLVPAYKGQLDILPGHAPLMTTLSTGVLKYRAKGATTFEIVVVSWGYMEVHPEGVIILADVAESLEEIDRQRAEAGLKKAQEAMIDPLLEADQIEMMQIKVARNQARLEALGGGDHGHTTH
ncbi:MAG TPA: ATP synthase F1 subunit epsilon [Bdellovibrionales bacterium]|nr:ATP synthase F1 subunit epsilon [Bdellovibrionales bacterium]